MTQKIEAAESCIEKEQSLSKVVEDTDLAHKEVRRLIGLIDELTLQSTTLLAYAFIYLPSHEVLSNANIGLRSLPTLSQVLCGDNMCSSYLWEPSSSSLHARGCYALTWYLPSVQPCSQRLLAWTLRLPSHGCSDRRD